MEFTTIEQNGVKVTIVANDEKIITDIQSALDLLATVDYETGANRIILNKDTVDYSFFVLSSGLAGDVLQKFITYHVKVAIYGDYSKYTSKPLKDFIYESNRGNDIFFVSTKAQAVEKLINAR